MTDPPGHDLSQDAELRAIRDELDAAFESLDPGIRADITADAAATQDWLRDLEQHLRGPDPDGAFPDLPEGRFISGIRACITPLDAIPDFLIFLPRWVLWREVTRKGRPTKIPLTRVNRAASSTDPTTWTDFTTIAGLRPTPDLTFHGVGICLGDLGTGEHLSGIDLDSCLDNADGTLATWAQPLVAALLAAGAYVEISPSGTGLKAFFRTLAADAAKQRGAFGIAPNKWGSKRTIPGAANGHDHPPAVEVYLGDGRYFAVTARPWADTCSDVTLVDRAALIEIAALVQKATAAPATDEPQATRTSRDSQRKQGRDQSRSALAFRRGAQARREGASFEQMCETIRDDPATADWYREKGEPDDKRELHNIWRNAAPDAPAPEIDVSILRLNRRAPPVFPLAVFGAEWMGWLKNAAEAACCPVDYVAAPLLAGSSALIGNSRWVSAWHGWAEPPHLWIGTVGDSGDGKTPGTVALLNQVVPELERRMVGDYPDRLREWETNAEVAKLRQAEWQQAIAKATKKNDGKGTIPPKPADADPGAAPQEPRIKLHDVTVEKVASTLAFAAPKGLLMVRDELAGFLLGMNQYNDAARAFWLEAWNGGPYLVDRMKNAQSIKVSRLVVAWFGTIQPERLAEVMEQPDDGLLARFLWCWPDPIAFRRPRALHEIEFATRSLDRLRLLDMHRNKDGSLAPHLVPLQEAALPRLLAFADETQRRRDLAAGLLRSSYGKARGVALRVALVLEMLWWCARDGYDPAPTVISDAALDAATLWVSDYAIPMAERTFGDAASSQGDRNITTLARWIAQERPTEVHVRTLQRDVRLPGLREAETIHAACGGLADAGWLLPAPRGYQVRGTLAAAYPVNPALWEALR